MCVYYKNAISEYILVARIGKLHNLQKNLNKTPQ